MNKKVHIGVLIYTKIGTNTSILMDEFRFFNHFKKHNEDVEFTLIAVSDHTEKSIMKNLGELNFPVSVIKVKDRSDLHKLHGLSGVFTYMMRNTFFGGSVDKPTISNYMICSYCTNDLQIPLFVRTPDSEYPYFDYQKMIDYRLKPDLASSEKFRKQNAKELLKIEKVINYDLVYFIANGSRKIADWVVDIAYNDVSAFYRVMEPEEISKRTLFVSDSILFNVWDHYEKYSYLEKKATQDRLVFIGYLQGSVAKNRLKALPKIFKDNLHEIPTDIIGPGASVLEISRPDVDLQDKGVYGKDFFELMNSYLAYIFVGKGNPINKYINKTVYDCLSARCPVIVFRECDQTQVIFDDNEFYFSNEDELKVIYEKLKDPAIRENWIDRQYEEIKQKLIDHADPLFHFNEFCKPSEGLKYKMKLTPLF